MSQGKRKLALVGLDAIIPEFAAKLIAEGKMPNLKKLRDAGFWTELIPTVPAWTPNGWATLATGANSSTHGIEGFFIHTPGEEYEVEHHGFDSAACKAEFIWEAAQREGKKSIVFKYPGTWPRRSPGIIQIGGAGGYGGLRNELDINHATCYTTESDLQNGTLVNVKPAKGWKNLPADAVGALEAELPVDFNRPARAKSYWLLILPDDPSGARVLLTKGRDAAGPLAVMRQGEWSGVVHDTFELGDGTTEGGFEMKLLRLDDGGHTLRLYMSQNLPRDGFCQPSELDAALWREAGAPTEYTAMYYLRWGWFDVDTQMEIFRRHAAWVQRAVRFLLTTQDWDIFYSQFHPIDYAQHIFWGGIDPEHPDYRQETAGEMWADLAEVYTMGDAILGVVMECVGDDTVVACVGDHGHQPYRWTVHLNNYFRKHGLLDVTWDEESQQWVIDWSKTKAYAFGPVHVAINLKGRDPQGIVEPKDYEAVREQVSDLLYELKHSVTGKRPIKVVMTREEIDAFGLYGDGVGDLVFFTKPGYDAGNAERLGHSPIKAGVTDDGEIFQRTHLFRDMTSEHPSQAPWEKLTRTLFCLAGPGVKRGVTRVVPGSIVDVTATLCDLAKLPYPAQNEGHPMVDAFSK